MDTIFDHKILVMLALFNMNRQKASIEGLKSDSAT
jgi:hypothetical protein